MRLTTRGLETDRGSARVRSRAPDRLLTGIVRRRKWAVHRHVHLLAAFRDAAARDEITSVLAVGCGVGLSELYLAALHPEVTFTLTDYNPKRLEVGRRWARDNRLENVRFASVNLLSPPGSDRHDLVTSIEVLEHIGRDQQAAVAHGGARLEVRVGAGPGLLGEGALGPGLLPGRLAGARARPPGYTERTLSALFEEGHRLWVRSCYAKPDAYNLRRLLEVAPDDQVVARRHDLVAEAERDILDEILPGGQAAGIEVLLDVRG